jgi:hypothetical protein
LNALDLDVSEQVFFPTNDFSEKKKDSMPSIEENKDVT